MTPEQFDLCAGRAPRDSRTMTAARAILVEGTTAAVAASQQSPELSRQVATRAAKKIRQRHEAITRVYGKE